MTEEEYNNATDLEKILYDKTGMLAKNHYAICEAMKEYVLHVAEKAVGEERSYWLEDDPINACDSILSRIKELTQ